jgi:hypothetical protein
MHGYQKKASDDTYEA